MEIKELPTRFQGRGPMKEYNFKQIKKSPKAYIYEVSHPLVQQPHYEVFLRKINRRFNQVSYPRGESFGYWAWCIKSYEKAIAKFEELSA